jgi:hypothetical protein
MLQGGPPYAGMTAGQVLHAVSTGATLGVPPAAPDAVQLLLARCLDPEPSNRCDAPKGAPRRRCSRAPRMPSAAAIPYGSLQLSPCSRFCSAKPRPFHTD